MDQLRVEWAVPEGRADAFQRSAEADGAAGLGRDPFRPPAEEAELFGDPQMEPLTVVALGMTGLLFLRYLHATVDDLRGGEILVIDLDAVAGDGAQVRRISLGRARKVIVKHGGGTETFAVERFGELEARLLALLGRG